MLNVMLYLIALVTGMLAFSGIAAGATGAMMLLFEGSLILLVLSVLTRGFKRNVVFY